MADDVEALARALYETGRNADFYSMSKENQQVWRVRAARAVRAGYVKKPSREQVAQALYDYIAVEAGYFHDYEEDWFVDVDGTISLAVAADAVLSLFDPTEGDET